jgi:hypothetical protein
VRPEPCRPVEHAGNIAGVSQPGKSLGGFGHIRNETESHEVHEVMVCGALGIAADIHAPAASPGDGGHTVLDAVYVQIPGKRVPPPAGENRQWRANVDARVPQHAVNHFVEGAVAPQAAKGIVVSERDGGGDPSAIAGRPGKGGRGFPSGTPEGGPGGGDGLSTAAAGRCGIGDEGNVVHEGYGSGIEWLGIPWQGGSGERGVAM